MTTLLPLGSAKSDSKNMKFTLMSGPPVDKKCEHCGLPHLVSDYNFKCMYLEKHLVIFCLFYSGFEIFQLFFLFGYSNYFI